MINSKTKNKKNTIWIGSTVALLSAAAFALNLVLAGVSYEYGANIHSLNLSRAAGFLACLGIAIKLKGVSITLPPRIRLAGIVIGILLCTEMYTLLGAIQTIPVALAVLIFYTYPMIIAIYRWIAGQEKFSWKSAILLSIVFIGLSVVLIDSPVALEKSGIILAIAAAFVMATMLIGSEHSLNHYDNHVVLFYSLIVVTLVILALSLTAVDLQWPTGLTGWSMLAGSSIFYIVATFCLFKAVSLIGPLKTAIVDNTAPVWAILFGYLLLQQVLGSQQIFGVFIVMLAVVLLQPQSDTDA